VYDAIFGRDLAGSGAPLGSAAALFWGLVLVGLVATLLVGLSTVLARCPGSDWFEYCFAAALAHQDPAHELEVRPISDVAVCWFLALSAEDHAIEALHGTRDRVRGRRVGE